MVRFYEKWDEVEKWNDSITPYAREMLDTNEKEARKLQIIHGRGEWYETIDKYGKKFLVSVVDVMCDCGMWQISGLPCMHVIAVFMYRREFAQLTNMRQLTNMISGLPCMHVIAVFMYRVAAVAISNVQMQMGKYYSLLFLSMLLHDELYILTIEINSSRAQANEWSTSIAPPTHVADVCSQMASHPKS
ncbi:hypothetical protein QYF36_012818 [Acer negundo]|nr:hypothetical protein QYF36_012818 [Acer negundo]